MKKQSKLIVVAIISIFTTQSSNLFAGDSKSEKKQEFHLQWPFKFEKPRVETLANKKVEVKLVCPPSICKPKKIKPEKCFEPTYTYTGVTTYHNNVDILVPKYQIREVQMVNHYRRREYVVPVTIYRPEQNIVECQYSYNP